MLIGWRSKWTPGISKAFIIDSRRLLRPTLVFEKECEPFSCRRRSPAHFILYLHTELQGDYEKPTKGKENYENAATKVITDGTGFHYVQMLKVRRKLFGKNMSFTRAIMELWTGEIIYKCLSYKCLSYKYLSFLVVAAVKRKYIMLVSSHRKNQGLCLLLQRYCTIYVRSQSRYVEAMGTHASAATSLSQTQGKGPKVVHINNGNNVSQNITTLFVFRCTVSISLIVKWLLSINPWIYFFM